MNELFGNSAVMLTRKKGVSWSFSKETRFKNKKKVLDVGYLAMPSTLSPRATVMGFGTRWTPSNAKGKDSPPPGSYYIPSTLDTKGVKIVKESSLPPITPSRFMTPGPGTYNCPTYMGKESPKYTFHGIEVRRSIPTSPAPGCYSPKTAVVEFAGFKEISFGIGERKMFRRLSNDVPGPGTYDISSNFDKFKTFRQTGLINISK